MTANERPTQVQRIHKYLNDFGSITQFEAMRDLGVMRLASRISEMRKDGFDIVCKMETTRNRYGEKCHVKRYSLKKEAGADGH